MSNVKSLHPLRFALGAALAASALAGCGVEVRPSTESEQVDVSTLALSKKADPKPASPPITGASTTTVSDAASALRAGSTPLKDAGQALDQLASKLEQVAGTGSSTISQRLRGQATALRDEIKTMAGTDQRIEKTARALERMHLSMLQAERMEGQIRADAEKLGGAEGGGSTSPDGLARLREQLAALQRSADAHVAGSADMQAAAQHADQLARDLGAELTKRYSELAASTRQLLAAVDKANGNARALTGVANNVDTLRGGYSAADRTIGSLFDDLILVIQGPTRYNDDWIAQTGPVLTQLEVDIQPYVPQAVADRGSLRVLTYNTAFVAIVIDLPFPLSDITIDLNRGVFSGLDYGPRAKKIAEGILRGDQDVVVLNEVFSVQARKALVQELSGTYPNYVEELAGEPLMSGKTPMQMYMEGVLPDWATDLLKSLQIPGLMEYIVTPGNSGLMVFSKYKLLPLPGPNDADCVDEACRFSGWNDGHALLPDEVAFHVYDHCTTDSDDCFASKGVGLVKLDTPGDPSYVAFTHIQADEKVIGENAADREIQFDEVEDVLVNNIPTADLFGRRVFFAGDMNVPGRNRDDLNPGEWLDLFAGNGGNMCYACGNGGGLCHHDQNGRLFTDPWGFETSTLDPGLSQLNDHERLDYILHNAAGGRSCMQYIHIAYDVSEDGHWYSDHLPMREDFNASAGACSANDAAPAPLNRPREVLFTGTNCDFDSNTPAPPCQSTYTSVAPEAKLTHAGSFQWYRITQAGSYSIKLEASDPTKPVDFEVYQGADMSRPIKPFSDEAHPRWGVPYSMLEPPYYIRVFAKDANGKPDRSAASANREYRIDIHQHLCRNAEDACFLQAATKYPYIWPETTNITNVNELYFKFKTSGVANGHLSPQPLNYPMVRFQEESNVGSNLDCLDPLELQEWNGVFPPVFVQNHAFTKVETDADDNWDDVDGPDRRYVAPDLDGDKQDEFKYYYVKMNRKQKIECEAPFPTNLRFETDLTYFRGGRTRCYLQYDDSGVGEDDHTRFHLFFDEPPFLGSPSFCDTHFCWEGTFDQKEGDNWLSDVPSLQGYFVKQLTVGMWENDNGDDMLFNSWQQPISPTPFFLRHENANMYITDNPDPVDADYSYRMEYVLCREKNDCDPAM